MSNSFIEQVGGIQQSISQPCFIGIIAKHYKDGSKYPEGNQYSYSSDDLSNAISDNGGVPLILTSGGKEIIYANNDTDWKNCIPQNEKDILIAQIGLCKGIILQGGVESDAYEIFVANYCYNNNIPILGICAGQNNMVRALGGKSMPVPDLEKHNRDFYSIAHTITIEQDTKLFSMLNCTSIKVNSIHTNVIDPKSLEGTPFIISARDSFGNIEAVEIPDKLYFAIRFHPESLRDNLEVGKEMNNFFDKFIKMCEKNRQVKRGDINDGRV